MTDSPIAGVRGGRDLFSELSVSTMTNSRLAWITPGLREDIAPAEAKNPMRDEQKIFVQRWRTMNKIEGYKTGKCAVRSRHALAGETSFAPKMGRIGRRVDHRLGEYNVHHTNAQHAKGK